MTDLQACALLDMPTDAEADEARRQLTRRGRAIANRDDCLEGYIDEEG